MSPRARAAAVLAAAALLGASAVSSAKAQPPGGGEGRRAYLFLLDRVSFEEALAVPEIRALAVAGGAGLMSRREHPDDGGLGPFLTIGAGAKAAVPSSRIAPLPDRTAFPAETLAEIERLNRSAVPGLMGELLAAAGYRVELYGNSDDRFGPNAPGLLAAMDLAGHAEGRIHGLAVSAARRLGALRADPNRLEALIGGPAGDDAGGPDLAVVDLGDTHRIDQEAPYARTSLASRERPAALARTGRLIRRVVSRAPGEVLVVVATPTPSLDMDERGDVVTPLVVARGRADALFPEDGAPRGLTSESTRYPGIVLAEDVAPTVLDFFGVSKPADMTGAPVTVQGRAPFEAHLRHLDHRRIRVPVQTGFGLGALAVTLCAGFLALRGRSRRVLAVAGAAAACATGVPLALLAVGALPDLVYAQVVPVGIGVAVVAGLLAWRAREDADPTRPVVLVAGATALAVVIDAALGWRAAATSLAGGTVFEGRTYGLRNVWLGPVLAGAVLVGSRLRARVALALGLAAAAFVGLPWVGADVGGFATVSIAAWLLYFSLARGGVGWREAVLTAVATVGGLAVLFVVDAVLTPNPTHAGRFAERVAEGGLGTFSRVAGERLRASFDTTNSVPAAWLLVVWLAFAAWAAPRVGGVVGRAFDRAPGYREAMWVLAVATLLAVVANDTGIATAQTAGAYSIGGFVVPAVAYRLGRREAAGPSPGPAAVPAAA